MTLLLLLAKVRETAHSVSTDTPVTVDLSAAADVESLPPPVREHDLAVYAHLSYGRWVADCPTDANAMLLEYGQTRFECAAPDGIGSDGTTADLIWPPDIAAIELSVAGLPVEDQNWDWGRVLLVGADLFVLAEFIAHAPDADLIVSAALTGDAAWMPGSDLIVSAALSAEVA